jgi:hypothetical protein
VLYELNKTKQSECILIFIFHFVEIFHINYAISFYILSEFVNKNWSEKKQSAPNASAFAPNSAPRVFYLAAAKIQILRVKFLLDLIDELALFSFFVVVRLLQMTIHLRSPKFTNAAKLKPLLQSLYRFPQLHVNDPMYFNYSSHTLLVHWIFSYIDLFSYPVLGRELLTLPRNHKPNMHNTIYLFALRFKLPLHCFRH